MESDRFARRVLLRLGMVPDGIAVMGKWEPFLPARRCLDEVAARAAAALAISEALQAEGTVAYLLSAEARLRGQPRPGCLMAAQILVDLGAAPERIRFSAAANRTSVEVQVLERMRRELQIKSLLCITASYHAERARRLMRRAGISSNQMQVLSCQDGLVDEALAALPGERRQDLLATLHRGGGGEFPLTVGWLNERLARLGGKLPALEKLLADWVRGPGLPQAPIERIES